MTMPETTVGLPGNNLFGNLIASTRPSLNGQGSQALHINSVQSDTKVEDGEEVEGIENTDNIPFQEILGQHICNLNIYNHFAGANNGHPSISPFVPLSQRESKWGFEERKGINVILDRHLIETHNPGSIFSLEKSDVNAVDEMEKPFIQDVDVRNTLPRIDTLKLNPLNNPETLQVSGASSLNVTVHPHLNLPPSPLSPSLRGTGGGIQGNNEYSPPLVGGVRGEGELLPLNNMQQSDLYSAGSSEINMKELPETYKLLAQNISPENKNGVLTPVINGSSKNTTEQHTESGLSKINGTESSRQDISSISQTNEDWNSFDSHTQKQNTSDTVSFDAHTPKTNNGNPFSLDSQTTVNNAQSNATDFQQNTKASPNSGTPLSSYTSDAKTVNHIFHSNDMSNVGYTHENIMEQIFQKIRITTHGDRSEIKLSLNPPELGNIKIHFMEENDKIEAKIYVENAEVKAAVEKNAHHLKESVAANGIEIHKLEVYIQNDDANKQKLTEYFDAYNPHHHNQTHSQKGYDEDQILNEEDITGNLQTKNSTNASNLMVDYII